MPPDDLLDLLGPTPPPPGEAELAAVIARRTGPVIARRRWGRRVRRAAAVGLVFGAGGVAGWVGKPTPGPAPGRVEYVAVPVPVVVPPPEEPPAEEYPTADRVELQAEQAADRAEAARLYRLAGDRYLSAHGDPAQAVRCYRLFLLAAGPAGRAAAGDDSWLLMSLKASARREANREQGAGL